jgi:hypothetical protein
MRISKILAVSATGCALAASVALPATAGPAHPAAAGTFHSTISTHNPHAGTKVTMKATGAVPKTNYVCIFTIVKGTAHNENPAYDTSATSSKKGAFTCSLKFKPFKLPLGGKTYSCPVSKSAAKSGVKCGFAAADPFKQTSNTIQYFKAK